MTTPPYTREVLRLATAIPNLKSFEELDGATEARSKTCGSRIRVAVELDQARRVVRLRQAVEACAYGQAAAALMGRYAEGRSRADVERALEELGKWLAGRAGVPQSWPGLEALEPALARKGRHGAILLPFQALLLAMEEAQ